MPWKVHIENTKPVGGNLPGAHIVPELSPLLIVKTQEEAKDAMTALIRKGVKNIYAVGFDP